MRVPVVFTWERSGSGLSKGQGITRDVSSNGAYVYSETCPPAKAVVYVEILLPKSSRAGNVVIKAKMRARRVESSRQPTTQWGFSAVGTSKGLGVASEPAVVSHGRPGHSGVELVC